MPIGTQIWRRGSVCALKIKKQSLYGLLNGTLEVETGEYGKKSKYGKMHSGQEKICSDGLTGAGDYLPLGVATLRRR